MGRRLQQLAAACVLMASLSAQAAEPRNVAYVDAHSHLYAGMRADEEIQAFRDAGVAAVLIMWPDPWPVRTLADQNPGYVIPMLSISSNKTVLSDATPAMFANARDEMGFCGFGELATRLLSNGEISDADSISDPRRMAIYDLAEAKGTAVNMHVSLEDPATIAAYERIVALRAHAQFVLNHGGLTAGPELLGRLLARYPNVYVELSGRLTPPTADRPRPQSALDADGMLKSDWRALFERFPDRFLFGMDVNSDAAVQGMPERLAIARKAFAELPLEIEENIAFRNVGRILKGCGGLPIG